MKQPPAATGKRRILQVRHVTRYTYDRPVERSSHVLHLRPVHDLYQRPKEFDLKVTPELPVVEYEDVFGNWTGRFEVVQPYTELVIRADATVELLDVDPFAFAKAPIRPSFPVVWMPWENKMLAPYLVPDELPETQLRELSEYAMGFASRNDGDLMETLFAINLEMFRQYQYVPGSTNLSTTAFDVFTAKKGVCQDFANLFICMARLLGIPARYVCGYIYTGNTRDSRAGSDASHAWVQLYIPNVGWKGFDPTNGVLACTDHVRVAWGRNYKDVTPTAGTLYSPANEFMMIDVEVKEPNAAAPAPAPPLLRQPPQPN